MATHAQRQHLAALMDYLVAHEPQVHYPPGDVRTSFDSRTFNMSEQQLHHILDGGGSIQADCSEMVTELSRWVGLDDPNGLGYRYAGYTGTMLRNPRLKHYLNPRGAGVGAIGVYYSARKPDGIHAVMVRKPGRNPVVFSHGSERGPLFLTLEAEHAYHAGESFTFLTITQL